MDPAAYWQSRAEAAVEEYEATLQAQRNELEALQRQVSNLLHERSLMKAATANDVRAFCVNYQATAQQQQQQQQQSMAVSSPSAASTPGAVEAIPVYDLLMFLHRYSNGLVPPPENRRKRFRTPSTFIHALYGPPGAGSDPSAASSSSSAHPAAALCTPPPAPASHIRLYQRMLARQRGTVREGDAEEYAEQLMAQQQQQQHMRMDGGGGDPPPASAYPPQPLQ